MLVTDLRQDTTQHRPDHIGGQPRDPVGAQQQLGKRGLAHPRGTADKVKDAPGHGPQCANRDAAAVSLDLSGSRETL